MDVKSEPLTAAQNGTVGAVPLPDAALIGLSAKEMSGLLAGMGEPAYRGRQIAAWIYAKGILDFAAMTNLPGPLRERLAAERSVGALSEVARRETPDRKTRKIGYLIPGGGIVESVYMTTPRRITFCLSSQHGCGFACRFCATGRMGRGRNLSAGEIVEQVLRLRRELPAETRDFNIVLMGMGEPLENYEQVTGALSLLIDPDGMAVPARRITLSTVGLAPQIIRLADEGWRVRLAISLHSADDAQRSRLMPVNRRFPLETLMRAVRHYADRTGHRVTFEYILIEEINDSVADAARLVRLTGQLPCKINLIPYNPIGPGRFRRPSPDRIQRFADYLRPRIAAVTVRYSQGVDIGAACGQLAGGAGRAA
jgi:23S rRNA (adenine2503-C2)-methyltransferase